MIHSLTDRHNAALTLANLVSDIVGGLEGIADPTHVPAECEICQRVAGLIEDFAASSSVSPETREGMDAVSDIKEQLRAAIALLYRYRTLPGGGQPLVTIELCFIAVLNALEALSVLRPSAVSFETRERFEITKIIEECQRVASRLEETRTVDPAAASELLLRDAEALVLGYGQSLLVRSVLRPSEVATRRAFDAQGEPIIYELPDASLTAKGETPTPEIARDAKRYRRLQILGAAPGGSKQLDQGTVLCFTNLDAFIDHDLELHPSRGEAHPISEAAVPVIGNRTYCWCGACNKQVDYPHICPAAVPVPPPHANEKEKP